MIEAENFETAGGVPFAALLERQVKGEKVLSGDGTRGLRACLGLDAINHLEAVMRENMAQLRAAAECHMKGCDAAEVDGVIDDCESRLQVCVRHAVYAARAVGSPLAHEIPGALPMPGKEMGV